MKFISHKNLLLKALRRLYLNTLTSRVKRSIVTEYNGRRILSIQQGNDLIFESLNQKAPLMIGKIGSVELSCLMNYLDIQKFIGCSSFDWVRYFVKGHSPIWKEDTRFSISNNAGVFPTTDQALEDFSTVYLESLQNLDIMQVWFNSGEGELIEEYCANASYTALQSVEPYFSESPWSSALEGRRVLVIHPFTDTIVRQYKNRHLLFSDPRILPEFELITLKAIQSRGNSQTEFQSWLDALDWMKEKISKIDFEIAIIGAGAYGLPLAAHVKSLGKKGIHMGGATQIFFGIKGKRWDSQPSFTRMFNQHWCRPDANEYRGSEAVGRTGKDYW